MSMYGGPAGGMPGPASNMRARLRPMGIGDILDETFRLYRENFALFVATVGVLEVPAQVINLLLTLGGPASVNIQQGQTGLTQQQINDFATRSGLSAVGGIIVALVSTFIAAAMAVVISHCYLDRPITTGEAYRATLSRLGALVVTVLWAGIRLILMAVTIIGIPFAIYFGVSWSLMSQVVMLENRGGGAATARSRELVRGYWWKTLGLLIVVGLLVGILTAIPSIIVGAILGSSVGSLTTRVLISGIFGLIIAVLTTPIQISATTLLFYDLKIRKEAFDLEALVQQAGFGSSAPTSPGQYMPPSQY